MNIIHSSFKFSTFAFDTRAINKTAKGGKKRTNGHGTEAIEIHGDALRAGRTIPPAFHNHRVSDFKRHSTLFKAIRGDGGTSAGPVCSDEPRSNFNPAPSINALPRFQFIRPKKRTHLGRI
ncbi:MAG TPA: hypothetical protein VG938_12605 [Verrucomicrobiae bacterium]|jgi:hypothetical protein|nr:hypothetical protein [Verrucomicrobiae bacterium]